MYAADVFYNRTEAYIFTNFTFLKPILENTYSSNSLSILVSDRYLIPEYIGPKLFSAVEKRYSNTTLILGVKHTVKFPKPKFRFCQTSRKMPDITKETKHIHIILLFLFDFEVMRNSFVLMMYPCIYTP